MEKTRYHYNALNELVIMRFIGTAGRPPFNTDVDIIYSERPSYTTGKRRISESFWARSRFFMGRADKVSIIRRKFEE